MKTIKQIADEIGVTKQAVFYHIKKEPLSSTLQPFMEKVDGVLMVGLDGENLIKQAFNSDTAKTLDAKEATKDPSKDNGNFDGEIMKTLQDTIAILRDQLEVKDGQLEVKDQQLNTKDKQISELTAALENTTESLKAAQVLHAGTMQGQLTAGADPGEDQADPSVEVHAQEQKGGWFSRWFGRKG